MLATATICTSLCNPVQYSPRSTKNAFPLSTRPSCDCNCCCREKTCQHKHLYTIVCHTVCVRQLLPLLHAPKLTAIDPPVLIRAAKRHCSRNKVYIQRLHFSSFLFFFTLSFYADILSLCFALRFGWRSPRKVAAFIFGTVALAGVVTHLRLHEEIYNGLPSFYDYGASPSPLSLCVCVSLSPSPLSLCVSLSLAVRRRLPSDLHLHSSFFILHSYIIFISFFFILHSSFFILFKHHSFRASLLWREMHTHCLSILRFHSCSFFLYIFKKPNQTGDDYLS